jgi:hypothetical protein
MEDDARHFAGLSSKKDQAMSLRLIAWEVDCSSDYHSDNACYRYHSGVLLAPTVRLRCSTYDLEES